MKLVTAIALVALSAPAAAAQPPSTTVPIQAGETLLNITAEGRAERRPDLATFNAGVVTQAKTGGEAMRANSEKMAAVIAALRRSGVEDRDIQTSTLHLQPHYYYPQRERPAREPGRTTAEPAEPEAPRIIGYEARNSVSLRVRRIERMGPIVDALVTAGVNQIDGPHFTVEDQEAAVDEARVQAMRNALARAELYARASGLRVARVLTISEGGGYFPVARDIVVTGSRMASPATPPPPAPPPAVEAGEVTLGVMLSVQFALAR